MTRRSEREARVARAISETVDDVLANWGIDLGDDPDTLGYDFARQIGFGEAVEFHEVYGLILDVAKEVFALTGKVDAVGIPTTSDDASEVLRLRAIIALAYSQHSWDGSALKGLLALGLEPARVATHAHAHQWGPPLGRPRATVCTRCGATRSVIEED